MEHSEIENLDYSILTRKERTFLKKALQTKPFIWLLGVFCGAEVIFALSVALVKGDNFSTYFFIMAGIKGVIFVALSLWARSWSLSAAILLLLWHLYSNSQLLLSNNTFSNLKYLAFALLFFVGMIAVNRRRSLLKKVISSMPNNPFKRDEQAVGVSE